MKNRVLFLISLYVVLTLTFSGIVGVPQVSLAGDGGSDPPLGDTIPDTTSQSSSVPSTSPANTEINYWYILKTIITIGI